jgi:hypothetical protein
VPKNAYQRICALRQKVGEIDPRSPHLMTMMSRGANKKFKIFFKLTSTSIAQIDFTRTVILTKKIGIKISIEVQAAK